MGEQLCKWGIKKAGLRTQRCGPPVFSVRVDVVWVPMWTFCHLLVRKSKIHEQSVVVNLRFLSLFNGL